MASIFDTSDQGETRESPITVKAGVAPAKEDTFLTGLAVEAGMEVVAQQALGSQQEGLEDVQEKRNEELGEIRLKSLNEKFDALSVGVTQGLPTAQANARARALLAETKAAVPWIGNRADNAFKSFFGGSSGAGGFTETPQEKAIKEYQGNIASVSASMGVSLKTAQTVVDTKATNDANEELLRQQVFVQENNAGGFRNWSNTAQQSGSIAVQAMMESQMQGATTLNPQGLQSVNATISNMGNRMKMDLRRLAFNPKDGTPLLTEEDMNKQVEEINKWVKDQKSMVADSSYQSLVQSISETKTAEIAVAAADTLPLFSVIQKAGGTPLVESYIKGVQDPRYVKTLVDRLPQLAKFFDGQGRPKQILLGSLAAAGGQTDLASPDSNKVWARDAINQGGAEIAQTFLGDSQNVASSEAIYKQVDAENPEAAKTARDTHKQFGRVSPSETGRTLSGPTFRQIYKKNPDAGFKVMASSVEGMAINFKSAFLEASGSLPEYVTITPPEGGEGVFKATTSDGEPIPNEARKTLGHTYSVLKSNPKYVQEYEKLLGIPLTATEVMELSINGKVHKRFLDRINAQKGEFKGAIGRDIDKKQQEFEDMGAWGRALKTLRNRNAADRGLPWVFNPSSNFQVDPAQREIDLRQAPEPAPESEPQSNLTPEDVEYIKSATSVKEKARRAKLMGVPADDVDKIAATAVKIEERNK